MLETLFPLLGGTGLFLIGMMLLSGSLVAFAGAALQGALMRFTRTPRRAVASGAVFTALLLSSKATTVTLIGFVSAGLISFTQAVGVVIGASLGNTAVGWIVAGPGLNISLGFYSLPLIGIGALLRLLARNRLADLGMALAGFGVLFVGLDTLQEGMRGLSNLFDLAALPVGGLGARLMIMLVAIALTAVLQSSAAAIAMTLTAFHTDAINFDQAMVMVIGASIGTTLTSLLVSIGATVHAKRTAAAHILFNLIAGLIAIALLPVYSWLIEQAALRMGMAPGAMMLPAFHTLFIAVGVVLVLPFSASFARLVERLVPERGDELTQRLDASLLSIPGVAIEAAQRALTAITQRLFGAYDELLAGRRPEDFAQLLAETRAALDRSFEFVSRIPLPDDEVLAGRRVAQLHAADHLLRFRERLAELDPIITELKKPVYAEALAQSRQLLAAATEGLEMADHDLPQRLAIDAASLAALSRRIRHTVLHETGADSPARALRVTDNFRHLERAGNHIWRICHYLVTAAGPPPPAPEPERLQEPEPEPELDSDAETVNDGPAEMPETAAREADTAVVVGEILPAAGRDRAARGEAAGSGAAGGRPTMDQQD